MNTTAANTNHKTFQQTNTTTVAATKETANKGGLVQRYLAFCDGQMTYRMAWFIFPALILPCLFMPLAIYTMVNSVGVGSTFSIYLFVSMSLFISGIIANVGGKTTRVTISLFLLAAAWNILYPLLNVLMVG